MSVRNSFKNLEIKFMQKNLLFIEGNVYDTFAFEKDRRIFNLKDKIKDIAKRSGYKHISYFDPILGEYDLMKDKIDDLINDPKPISYDEYLQEKLMDILKTKVDNTLDQRVYIFNTADIYFDNNNSEQFALIANLINSSLFENITKNSKEISDLQYNPKIIMITRSINNIYNLITNKNIEFASISINLPDYEERQNIFNNFATKFDISNTSELKQNAKIRNEAIALTDGMSCKEILQLTRVVNDEQITFRELFYLAKFSKKDSEWEKLDNSAIKKSQDFFNKRVKGQDFAIQRVIQVIKKSRVGLNGIMNSGYNRKPKGILFFAGSTGVGKTELAKSIAEFIFGDETRLIRFDMSEFSQEHSDQRLIGAPPGYVGFDSGGELTNAVKEKPYSILLFDEIEKAHNKIMDKFLQILEDGRLTSSRGELIDFSETMIIFTSNIGASKINPDDEEQHVRKQFIQEVNAYFNEELKRPELLNRISQPNIIPFNFITDNKIIKEIISSKIKTLNKNILQKHNLKINWKKSQEDIQLIIIEAYDKTKGGRGVVSAIEEQIIDPLTEFIFDNLAKINAEKNADEFLTTQVHVRKDKITFVLE